MTKVRFTVQESMSITTLARLLKAPEGVSPELVRHEYIDPPFRLRVRDLRIEDGALVGDVGPHYEGLEERGTLELDKLHVVVAKPILGGNDAA